MCTTHTHTHTHTHIHTHIHTYTHTRMLEVHVHQPQTEPSLRCTRHGICCLRKAGGIGAHSMAGQGRTPARQGDALHPCKALWASGLDLGLIMRPWALMTSACKTTQSITRQAMGCCMKQRCECKHAASRHRLDTLWDSAEACWQAVGRYMRAQTLTRTHAAVPGRFGLACMSCKPILGYPRLHPRTHPRHRSPAYQGLFAPP